MCSLKSLMSQVLSNTSVGGWGGGGSLPHVFVWGGGLLPLCLNYSEMVRHFPTKHSCDVYPQLHKAFQGLRCLTLESGVP